MVIFGSVGIFVTQIPLPSAMIAFCRGLLGAVFLLIVVLVTKKPLSPGIIKQHLPTLFLCSVALGANWIFLFEAYRYTTVATATVCYYFAPVILVLASPLLGERLTPKKIICATVSLLGLVLVSGVLKTGFSGLAGVLFGLAAATLYATVMLLSKKLAPVPAYDKTLFQLGVSALILIPYLLITDGFAPAALTPLQWALLLTVGILHTGVSYALYFDAIHKLNAQTVAVFSYIDPVVAILLSALLLKQPMDVPGICGSVLILGSALYSELPDK